MKCDAFDLRDIRRTCETMLAGVGISRDTESSTDQVMAYRVFQAAHYDRHTYTDEKRAALISWNND